ncbi:MAG: hypothetical protein AB7V18_10870 [Pyrinomonadaceae bacterium]
MKFSTLFSILFLSAVSVSAQTLSNEAIRERIKELGAENAITVELDQASNVTTIRAVADNFSSDDAKRADIRAMNFAVGLIYAGNVLNGEPGPFKLSFWVMSGKPVFAGTAAMQIYSGDELFDIREVRHVRRERDRMEYLNIQLTREQLKSLASQSNARAFIGRHSFNFTRSQLKLFADLYMATAAGTD